jgi:hypothetical protein
MELKRVEELPEHFKPLLDALSDLHSFLSVPRPSCRIITLQRVEECLHLALTYEVAINDLVELERRRASGRQNRESGTT